MIDKRRVRSTFQRCPTCGSHVAISASTCPVCGHEFQTKIDPTIAEPQPANTPVKRFSAARLPWGVFGVTAVIILLAVGAILLLRKSSSPLPAATAAGTPFQPVAALGTSAVTTTAPTWTPTAFTLSTITPVAPSAAPQLPTYTPIPPTKYKVQDGDTCSGIAESYNVPLSAFLALNNLDENNCLIRTGDTVLIPPPTPTAGPSPTLAPGTLQQASGTPAPIATHPSQIIIQVLSGDTCSAIAERNRVSVDTIIQQNGLDSSCSIKEGQVLTLTFTSPTPAISPTPINAQTPTPRVGYDTPVLISPSDGAQISETDSVVTLQWLSVGVLQDNEWYVVQVQPSGAITVPIFEVKATSLKLTRDILGNKTQLSFAWWVQVKQLLGVNTKTGERIYNNLSKPSEVRHFTWSQPVVTATPTPNP